MPETGPAALESATASAAVATSIAAKRKSSMFSPHECRLYQSHDFWSLKRKLKSDTSRSSVSKEHIESVVEELFGPNGTITHIINTSAATRDDVSLYSINSNMHKSSADAAIRLAKIQPPLFPPSSIGRRVMGMAASPVSSKPKSLQDSIPSLIDPDLDAALDKARHQVEQKAWARLEKASKALQLSVVRRRLPKQEAAFLASQNSISQTEIDLDAGMAEAERADIIGSDDEGLLALVTEDDIYDAILSLNECRDNNSTQSDSNLFNRFWSLIESPRQSITLEEFRIIFKTFHPSFKQYGMDEIHDTQFGVNHTDNFNQAIKLHSARLCSDYARLGIPADMRPAAWNTILLSELVLDHAEYSTEECRFIKSQVARYELITDACINLKVRMCRDDDTYFVFEEMIRNILLLWSRDEWIKKNIQPLSKHTGLSESCRQKIHMKGRWSASIAEFPPNGSLPLCGTSSYAMMISFIHSDVDKAYITFRELYARYFHHLNTISSHPFSIVQLCSTFESFLKQLDPVLYLSLKQQTNFSPFKPAFTWMLHAFVGTLEIEELLRLWDRVIGYNRLDLLSAVAAALYMFRREKLMAARSKRDIQNAFHDLAMVRIAPLLQYYFFVYNTCNDSLSRRWEIDASNHDDDE